MYELALFAGAGGGLLGSALLGWRAVCYVEHNAHCVKVLKQRIADGMLDEAPIWDDAETFDGHPWSGSVDIITAGFPCQPFSVAGTRRGADDERNAWPATIRIIREVRPRYCLLENVPALRCTVRGESSYFGTILGDLAASGYDSRWDCIPASAIGADHQRDRVWIVATDTKGGGRAGINLPIRPRGSCETTADAGWRGAAVADASSAGLALGEATGQPRGICAIERPTWWDIEPAVGRVANGVADRVERIRAIGNGQVPAVVPAVWRLLGPDSRSCGSFNYGPCVEDVE